MNDGVEYAMEYDPDYHGRWLGANPASRQVMNDIIHDIRLLYQYGYSRQQILPMIQPLLPNVAPGRVRNIIYTALLMPHIPRMTHEPNKRTPETESESSSSEDEEDLAEKLEKTHIK